METLAPYRSAFDRALRKFAAALRPHVERGLRRIYGENWLGDWSQILYPSSTKQVKLSDPQDLIKTVLGQGCIFQRGVIDFKKLERLKNYRNKFAHNNLTSEDALEASSLMQEVLRKALPDEPEHREVISDIFEGIENTSDALGPAAVRRKQAELAAEILALQKSATEQSRNVREKDREEKLRFDISENRRQQLESQAERDRAALELSSNDLNEAQSQIQILEDWKRTASSKPPSEEQNDNAWKDNYPATKWTKVSEFYCHHLSEGTGPFKGIKNPIAFGSGGYGKVFEAFGEYGAHYAVKITKTHSESIWKTEESAARRLMQRRAQRAGFATVREVAPLDAPGFIIYDFVEGTLLADSLRSNAVFRPHLAIKTAKSIACTLEELLQDEIPFSDLHEGNVIMRNDGMPVLIDPAACKPGIPIPEWDEADPFSEECRPNWSKLRSGLVHLNALLLLRMLIGTREVDKLFPGSARHSSMDCMRGPALPNRNPSNRTRAEELDRLLNGKAPSLSSRKISFLAKLLDSAFTDHGEHNRNKQPRIFGQQLAEFQAL